jgi:hypothetical protein
MAETISSAAEAMNTALSTVDEGFSATEQAAISAAEATLEQWEPIGSEIASGMEDALPTVQEAFDELAATSQSAAQEVLNSWAAEGAAMEADLAATMAEADEITAETGATMGTNLNAGMAAFGIALKLVGQPLQDFYTNAVTAAIGAQQANASAAAVAQDNITQANQLNDVNSAVAQGQKVLQDQVNAAAAAYEAALVPISGYGKTTAQLNAAIGEQAAKIETTKDALTSAQGELDKYANMTSLAGASVTTITAQIDAAAKANENLGFQYQDSVNAIALAMSGTGDLTHALQENQIAMDLSALKGGTVEQATQAINQAMAGSAFALRSYGINLKDGATGNQVLADTMSQVNGIAATQAQTVGGSLDILDAKWNQLNVDLGNTQGPLASVIKGLTDVVVAIDNWVQKNPQLAEALLVAIGVLGTLFVIVGSIAIVVGLLAFGFGAAAAGITASIIAIVAIVAFMATYIIADWGNIKDALGELWTQMTTDAEAFWNGLVTLVTNVVKSIESIVSGLVSNIQAAFAAIEKPIAAITGAVGGAASAAGNAIGGALGNITKLAAGGLVTSPTLALVGEAGPELVVPLNQIPGGGGLGGGGSEGGGGNIVINIGAVYGTDARAAQQVSDYIAKNLNTTRKLRRI